MKLIGQIIKVKKKTEEAFYNELFDKISEGLLAGALRAQRN